MLNFTPEQLRQAADIQERIQALQRQLSSLFELPAQSPVSSAISPPTKRRFSAAGIANIRAGAKARWAKFHAERGGEPAISRKPKRGMSPEGKARLAAFARARWKKVKAAGKSKL